MCGIVASRLIAYCVVSQSPVSYGRQDAVGTRPLAELSWAPVQISPFSLWLLGYDGIGVGDG
jgi:hypothetical protein